MAWVTPRTWVDGPHITAAQMNEISDALRETAPAKAQAAGDIFVGTGANAIKRLVIGSSGQVLKSTGSDVEWSSSPTPITTQGDLIVGDTNGNATRLPKGSEGQELQPTATGLQWAWPGRHPFDLYPSKQWWAGSSAYDFSLSGNVGGSIVARDLTLTGNITIYSASPAYWVCRTITLSANVSVSCKSIYGSGYVSPAGGGSGTLGGGNLDAGGTGAYGCGGGGNAGNSSSSRRAGGSGTISLSTQTIANSVKENLLSGSYFGGGGIPGSYATQQQLAGGGIFVIIANSITYGSHTLSIDCDGDNGTAVGLGANGGGGGGLCLVFVKTGTLPTVSASGGSQVSNVGLGSQAYGGAGGAGTAYANAAFPWT